jgi:glutamyl-tRNA synthetase
VVLRRNDGLPAYNLAVVIDDAEQGVTEVVRGDDLLPSTPRQAHLADLLGLPRPDYAHVPLVLGPDGERMSKRHGAITLADQARAGRDVPTIVGLLGASLALCDAGTTARPEDLLTRFDPPTVPLTTWTVGEGLLPLDVNDERDGR